MRRARVAPAVVAVLGALGAPAAASASSLPQADVGALERAGVRHILVKRDRGVTAAERAALRGKAGVRRVGELRLARVEVVRAPAGELSEALARLSADPDVEWAEPDAPVRAATDDAYWSLQWALENAGQTVNGVVGVADADIDASVAWQLGATGAAQVVGVVDTGVSSEHPDLASQIAVNPGESGEGRESNGVDDDANGLIDDWRGWDFVDCASYFCDANRDGVRDEAEGDASPGADNDPGDLQGHGSHVAGILAAAAENQTGIAGVAYDARVLPLRALDAGGRGTFATTSSAYDYAGDLGLRVVNLSLSSRFPSQAEYDAIAAHPDTLYVAAAGNDGLDLDAADVPAYPCAFDLANVVCVGASDASDLRAPFSNYGGALVDVFAPGVGIVSTSNDLAQPYWLMSGTSMAAPHVAGVAALLLSVDPSLTAPQLKRAILDTAEAKPALAGLALTGGRVDAGAAVTAVQAAAAELPEPDPPASEPAP